MHLIDAKHLGLLMGEVPRQCVFLLAILAVEALIPLMSAGQTTVADGAEGTSEGEGTKMLKKPSETLSFEGAWGVEKKKTNYRGPS